MAIFGTNSSAGLSSGGLANLVGGTFYTLTEDATVTHLSFFCQTTGNGILGLYTDVSGVPTNLIVQSPPFPVTAGFCTIDIPSTHLTAGNYWLGYMFDTGSMTGFKASAANGSNASAFNTGGTFSLGLPSVFPTPSYQADEYVGYATYNAGSVQGNIGNVGRHISVRDGMSANSGAN